MICLGILVPTSQPMSAGQRRVAADHFRGRRYKANLIAPIDLQLLHDRILAENSTSERRGGCKGAGRGGHLRLRMRTTTAAAARQPMSAATKMPLSSCANAPRGACPPSASEHVLNGLPLTRWSRMQCWLSPCKPETYMNHNL